MLILHKPRRVYYDDNNWENFFEVYDFEQTARRKGIVRLVVLKDGKRTFEKRVAKAEEGTQRIYYFKFQGYYYDLLVKK